MMERWTEARPVIVPGRHVEEPYASLFSGAKTMAQYVAEATTRVEPVTDDRPFFFARAKPWGVPRAMRYAFAAILVPLVVICLLFMAFGKPRGTPVGAYAGSIVYFAGLGTGFIAVELALLQHLTLLLGHPIFTLSILLFTLLAFGGVGSSVSRRFAPGPVCLAIAALGLVYAAALPRLVPALLPLGLPARIVVAVVMVAPLGFAMGMPFPRGLGFTGGVLPGPPFYWGLNGIFSVVGSLATMITAVLAGFTWAMVAGCVCYLVAAAAARSFRAVGEGRATEQAA
jgi:hypothetical protein